MKNIIKAMACLFCSLFLTNLYAQQKKSEQAINNAVPTISNNALTQNSNTDTSQSHSILISSRNGGNEQHEQIIIQNHNKINKARTLQIPANMFPANADTLQRKSR